MNSQQPTWNIRGEGKARRICLAGRWTLFIHTKAGKRLNREFERFGVHREMTWDFSEVEGLDSAGALFLWRFWDEAWPAGLECPNRYRHWFERLDNMPEFPPQPRWSVHRALEHFGGNLVGIMSTIWGLVALHWTVLADLGQSLKEPRITPWREISASVYRTGVSSMAILGVTGFVIGIVMSLQLGVNLKQFGANEQIIGVLGFAVLRELGPVIAGLIQSGRAGSSITAGIAGMHLTEELNALRTFGGFPSLRLVLPKVLAMAIVMPLLVVWTDFTEILGGMVAAQSYLDVPHSLFIARMPETVNLFDFWMGLIKGGVFGIIISVVGSYFGLKSEANTDSLSSNTTKSVVVSLSLILIFDAVFGAFMAMLGLFS